MTYDQIGALWPVFGGLIAFVMWLVRLEAKVMYLEKDKKVIWSKLDEIQKCMTLILTSLAKIEGKLENSSQHNKE